MENSSSSNLSATELPTKSAPVSNTQLATSKGVFGWSPDFAMPETPATRKCGDQNKRQSARLLASNQSKCGR